MIPVIYTRIDRDWARELAPRIAGPELRGRANESLLELEKADGPGQPRPQNGVR